MRPPLYNNDKFLTEQNRAKLFKNKNLLFWYENLYRLLFKDISDLKGKRMLEIGSGTSPLKLFLGNVLTSDVIGLDYTDYSFDCHGIHAVSELPDAGLDIIVLVNVLHHLESPLTFLERAACKLKPNGKVILTEPFFSWLSLPIYRFLHHEAVDFSIDEPVLARVEGPLSTANMSIPYLLFFSDKGWERRLRYLYRFSREEAEYYTGISYMATGGISRRIPIPFFMFKFQFKLDLLLARKFPSVFSSFFIMKLTRI